MKIKFKKFDKGVFYLDYMDEDLLNNSIEVKLISYSPKSDKPFNIRIESDELAHMDKTVLASFVDIPKPEDMTVDDVLYMMSDVKVEINTEDEDCINEIPYTQFIEPDKVVHLICGDEVDMSNINYHHKGSVLFTLPGLKFRFNFLRYRVTMLSSFKMIGKSNSLINYYLEILNLYLSCINLEES